MPTDDSSERLESLSSLWRGFAEVVYGSYSPIYSALARFVADDEDLLGLTLKAPPHAHDPNMLLASVNYLRLGGADPGLSELYARSEAAPELGPRFHRFCLEHAEELGSIMEARRIQTNECGRSAILALGVAAAVARLGEPVALLDAGASAGLNLIFDRYLLDYGPRGRLGPPESPVRIDCELKGVPFAMPARTSEIAERVGLDRSPVDLSDPDQVRWLLACVWPGTGRIERTAAAAELGRSSPPTVRPGDMVADLPAAVSEAGSGGHPVVVVTSWAYSYLSLDDRQLFRQHLARAGRRRPLAWLCADAVGVAEVFEPPSSTDPAEKMPNSLGLAVYDGSITEAMTLGRVHPHGWWIDWEAPSPFAVGGVAAGAS